MSIDNLTQHVNVLRTCVLYSLGLWGLVFVGLFAVAGELYTYVAAPLLSRLPVDGHLIATTITAPLVTPLKLALVVSCLLTLPVMLWLFWRFVAPGLYQGERRWVIPVAMTSIGLFYLGVAFAYFVVFPLILSFLISFVPPQVLFMPDISHYLSFVLYMTVVFGMLFQTPLFIVVLVRSGLVSIEVLRQNRRYVIVLAFVVGMVLTPPDVVSQIMLALPLWLLFEVGLLISRWFGVSEGNAQLNRL